MYVHVYTCGQLLHIHVYCEILSTIDMHITLLSDTQSTFTKFAELKAIMPGVGLLLCHCNRVIHQLLANFTKQSLV